jgi:AraC family transcriptional regulator
MAPTRIDGRPAADMWTRVVLRSVETMRAHLGEELPLRTLARSAWLSPFHFHRVFHRLTDTTPARLLAAWRIAEAKRMLAYGSESVTDICMRIGYSSLGTFTSQFTRVVGVSPGRFRRLVRDYADVPFHEVLAQLGDAGDASARGPVHVSVTGGPGDGPPAAVGLFDSSIPQRRPSACSVIRVPGTARFAMPSGAFRPLAMCFDRSVTVADAVATTDPDGCYVAAAPAPIRTAGRNPAVPVIVELTLRRRRPVDPPLLSALPLLTAAARATRRGPARRCGG